MNAVDMWIGARDREAPERRRVRLDRVACDRHKVSGALVLVLAGDGVEIGFAEDDLEPVIELLRLLRQVTRVRP